VNFHGPGRLACLARSARLLLLAGLAAAAASPVRAAAVQPGLERPAIAVRQPGRAVMLSVAGVGSRLVAVGERGVVALSDDGGLQWRQAKVPVSVTLTSVRFAGERWGLATGHGGVVLATTDRGETWKLVLDGRRIAQSALERARNSGDARAVKDAELMVADGPDKPLLDVLMLDERRAWVVGAYGLALATEDGGATWSSWAERIDNPKTQHLYAVRKRGDTVLLAGEQGLLLLSRDGGQNFQRIESPYRGSWFTAELIDERHFVVAGLRGNAWRSVDGGVSWAALPVPPGASITASALAADGRLLLASQAGFVMTVQADRVQALHAKPLPSVAGLASLEGKIVTVGVQGAVVLPGQEKSR
jgi:photosystem II stability/assembly factor-like uncharacterized protein